MAEEFLRRAKEYLRAAELTLYQGLYEVSALSSEVSAQLSLKALLYKLGIDPQEPTLSGNCSPSFTPRPGR